MTAVTDWQTPEGERKARDAYRELATREVLRGVHLGGTICFASYVLGVWEVWGGMPVTRAFGATIVEAYDAWGVRYRTRVAEDLLQRVRDSAREDARRRKRTLDAYALEGEGGIAR